MRDFDVLIVGGGIAGASVAANLAPWARVAVLERESHLGHHATGRSAALYSATYGNAAVRALSRASRDFLFSPPADFAESPLVRPRGWLVVARQESAEALTQFADLADVAGDVRRLTSAETRALCPILREDYLAGGVIEAGAVDIEVSALHEGYLRSARRAGGEVFAECEVLSLEHRNGRWICETTGGAFAAPLVINAAGAWADEIAVKAGAAPVGLTPFRRTAILVEPPDGLDIRAMPLIADVDEQFYFKPDAGLLLVSPADETLSAPCDAQPEDIDVAIAVDRFETATSVSVKKIRGRWAGLRTFAPDRTPVVGFDPRCSGFFWLAGQGGYGIQTAPALGRLAASLALGRALPADLNDPLLVRTLSPARQRT